MNKLVPFALIAAALPLAACSEETQDNLEQTAELAADDAAKNLDAAGEVIEDDLANAAAGVVKGAEKAEDHLRDDDDPQDELEAAPAFNGN